jgi:hypothetical protein
VVEFDPPREVLIASLGWLVGKILDAVYKKLRNGSQGGGRVPLTDAQVHRHDQVRVSIAALQLLWCLAWLGAVLASYYAHPSASLAVAALLIAALCVYLTRVIRRRWRRLRAHRYP